MERPRSLTAFFVSVSAVMLMITPLVPAARIEPCVSSQSIVIDFVIVTAPYPAGSRQLISPFVAVFEIAPAKVLHGAVRLHGLTSSPTPETHVRVAWASVKAENRKRNAITAENRICRLDVSVNFYYDA